MRERCSVFGSLSQGRRLLEGDLPRNLQKVAPRIDTLRYLRHTYLTLCLCVILMAVSSEANLSSEKADKRQEPDWLLCLCLQLRFAGSVTFEFHSLEADVLGLSVAVNK